MIEIWREECAGGLSSGDQIQRGDVRFESIRNAALRGSAELRSHITVSSDLGAERIRLERDESILQPIQIRAFGRQQNEADLGCDLIELSVAEPFESFVMIRLRERRSLVGVRSKNVRFELRIVEGGIGRRNGEEHCATDLGDGVLLFDSFGRCRRT